MAVGETAGQERPGLCPPSPWPPQLRRLRPRPPAPEVSDEDLKPLVQEADPEFERLLAEEEIERSTCEHHETLHFRPGRR